MAAKTFTMYDAVDVAKIPAHATMVLGYVDGHYVTVPQLRERFPHALIVTVTVTGRTLDADAADIEAGDLTPLSGAAWASRKIARGDHPTLYCSLSNWSEVRAAVRKHRIPRRQISYVVASYDNNPTIPRGAVAKQYSTGDYDTSAVRDRWPGVIPTGLTLTSRLLANRLTARLSRRQNPLNAEGWKPLNALNAQFHRVDQL